LLCSLARTAGLAQRVRFACSRQYWCVLVVVVVVVVVVEVIVVVVEIVDDDDAVVVGLTLIPPAPVGIGAPK